jgi:PncC family amidohydrolase
MAAIEQEIGRLLRHRGMTLGVVESATGGLLSQRITEVAGSSDYFKGSIVAYSDGIKVNVAGVKAETIGKYGAVSPQVAEEMAGAGRRALGVDICLADTGIAGPGGATSDKPVGLFYIGLAHRSGALSRRHIFQGDRQRNRFLAAEAAMAWLAEHLVSLD